MKKNSKTLKKVAKYVGFLAVLLVILLIIINFPFDNSPLVCKQNPPIKIRIEVLEKKLETTHDSDFLFLKIKFVNKTGKGIKIATGNLVFSDLSGNQIYSVDLGYPRGYTVEPGYPGIQTILPNTSGEESFPINYFPSIKGLVQLNMTRLKNMECTWTPDKIIYDDGTHDKTLHLKYSELTKRPPDDEMIRYEDFFESTYYKNTGHFDYICKDGTKGEEVWLNYRGTECKPGYTGCGGSSKKAIICSDQYVIEDFNVSRGPVFYGTYPIDTSSVKK